MTLTIADGQIGPTSPSGRPVTARRCCSNWLVVAPSIVQCPELCTRGASSLAMSRSPTWNSSRARTRSEEIVHEPADHRRGLGKHGRVGFWGGRDGFPQDAVAVAVLDERIAGGGAIESTGRDHRQLAVERH